MKDRRAAESRRVDDVPADRLGGRRQCPDSVTPTAAPLATSARWTAAVHSCGNTKLAGFDSPAIADAENCGRNAPEALANP